MLVSPVLNHHNSHFIIHDFPPIQHFAAILFQDGRSSELRLRRGVGQAAHTLNNPQVECTGVLLCVIREHLQLKLNRIGDISSAGLFITVNTLIVQLHSMLLSHCSRYTIDCNWSTRQLLLHA